MGIGPVRPTQERQQAIPWGREQPVAFTEALNHQRRVNAYLCQYFGQSQSTNSSRLRLIRLLSTNTKTRIHPEVISQTVAGGHALFSKID